MTKNTQPAGLIHDRLLSDVKQGDRVLFLGADLPLNYKDAPPSRPELASALAEKYDLPRGKSWPETATDYLSKFHNDRHGLVTFVRERCRGPQAAPGRFTAPLPRSASAPSSPPGTTICWSEP